MKRDRNSIPRLIITHWLLGGLAGVICAAGVLATDLGGLRTLILASSDAVTAIIMLFVGFAATFSGIVAATAVMMAVRDDDDDNEGGGKKQPVSRPAVVRAQG